MALDCQSLGGVPVFVAAEDVVGDVDVAGRHVVDPLGDGHAAGGGGARLARRAAAAATADGTDRRRTQREGRRSAGTPGMRSPHERLNTVCWFFVWR